jgi:hypothetical protein
MDLKCVGVLISLWLFLFPIFLFAAQPKEFFLDGLKKIEQRSQVCGAQGGICRVNKIDNEFKMRRGADKSLAFPICSTTKRIFLRWVK